MSRATALADRIVRDLPALLRPGDVLVANDTRVIPAQLTARRGDARIGITLDQPRADGTWHALARNARRLHAGDDAALRRRRRPARDGAGSATRTAAWRWLQPDGRGLRRGAAAAGALALPPYIERPAGPTPEDADDYQTIFAAHEGAVAAPTAGLHFTPALLAALEARGIGASTVTLHVGAGTFLPVRDRRLAHITCTPSAARSPPTPRPRSTPRARGGRVVAVGTTSLRLLETAADDDGTRSPVRRRDRRCSSCPATGSARSICC